MKYFKPEEFNCKCGCGANVMSATTLELLDKAREDAGIPFIVTSGYRCAKHNEASGGSPTSSHLKGLAVDIAYNSSSRTLYTALQSLLKHFPRVGIAKTFIHVDNDPEKPQEVLWLYP